MLKQKGQATVEFAFVLMFFFSVLLVPMTYVGFFFMDYSNYLNAARGVARAIAISDSAEAKQRLKSDFENQQSAYFKTFTKLYSPDPKVTIDDQTVQVVIELERNEEKMPSAMRDLSFPPKNVKLIQVVMPIEAN